MCGITGYVNIHDRSRADVIRRMTDAIAHRGPDASGIYVHPVHPVALGHRRLSIMDVSEASNQPFFSDDKRYVMVYNGEVYNYKELQSRFLPSYQSKTTSDTEIILQLFIEQGENFVHRLNGMFAISIYDTLQNKIWIFRDRVGIKPLFYLHEQGIFSFASEMKSLRKVPIDFSMNENAMGLFFHLGYIPQPYTLYKEIHKFPAGSMAVYDISNNHLVIKPYWEMHRKFISSPIQNEQEALSQLKDLMESSVAYCLQSDVPFGMFLSGGIDSSLVTAIASRKHPNLNTFSIRFDNAKHNEADHASKIANYLGTTHAEFTVTEKEAMDTIPLLPQIYDEPFADSSAIPTLMVSSLARKQVKMVLTGDGGDEQFMGYGSYRWANRLNNPLVFASRHLISKVLQKGNSRMQRAAKVFDVPGKQHSPFHIFSQEQYLFSANEIQALLPTVEWKTDDLSSPSRLLSAAEYQAYVDLQYYLKDDLLVKVDRATMHHGIEARVPILDHRIVEWSLNLHESLKYKGDISKYLLKQLLYQYIPETFFNRNKWGFSIPLDQWLSGPLQSLIADWLSDEMLDRSPLINKNEVKKYIQEFKNGKTYLYNRIWALIVWQMFTYHQSKNND
jgi:asparagine synthase (glutamine-hydrolysing)